MRNLNFFFGTSMVVLFFLVLLCYLFIDIPLALYCQNLDAGVVNFFGTVTALGISTWYLVGSLALFVFFRFGFRKQAYAREALFFFAAIAVSGIISNIIRFVAGRYRPEMLFAKGLYGFQFFEIDSFAVSFPSGHTTTAFAIAVSLSLFKKKYWPLFIFFALMIGASRLVITAHYLSDVIVGAHIGVMTVLFLKKFAWEAWGKKPFVG